MEKIEQFYIFPETGLVVEPGEIYVIDNGTRLFVGKVCYSTKKGFDIREYEHLQKYLVNRYFDWKLRPAQDLEYGSYYFTLKFTDETLISVRKPVLSEYFMYILSCSHKRGFKQYIKK